MHWQEYSYNERKQLKEAYMDLMDDFQPNSFITLATNGDGTIEGMRDLVKDFLARLDRKILGNAWLERPIHERTDGVFIIEHVTSNIHAHGLVRLAKNDNVDVEAHCKSVWGKLCPGGSVLMEPPSSTHAVARYISKESTGICFLDDQLIITREFMPF